MLKTEFQNSVLFLRYGTLMYHISVLKQINKFPPLTFSLKYNSEQLLHSKSFCSHCIEPTKRVGHAQSSRGFRISSTAIAVSGKDPENKLSKIFPRSCFSTSFLVDGKIWSSAIARDRTLLQGVGDQDRVQDSPQHIGAIVSL